MPKPITATIESKVNDPSMFEIWFRVDGALVGRGLITFNNKATAERFLSSMLNPEQFDVSENLKGLTEQLGLVVDDLVHDVKKSKPGELISNAFKQIKSIAVTEAPKPFITTTQGMSGWFAVMYWWNKENGGFWEPYETGFGRYSEEARAIEEAKIWAEAEEIAYQPRLEAYGDKCLKSAIDPKPPG